MEPNHGAQNLLCVNCSDSLKIDQLSETSDDDDDTSNLIHEFRVPLLWKSQEEEKVVTVYDALSEIYNLHPVMKTADMKIGKKKKNNNNNLGICDGCAQVLTNLYKFYIQLNHLRRENSFLAQKIQDLDTLLNYNMSIPIISHANSDSDDDNNDDAKPSLIELQNDSRSMEFCDENTCDGASTQSENDDEVNSRVVSSMSTLPSRSPWVNIVRLTSEEILAAAATTTTTTTTTPRRRRVAKNLQVDFSGDADDCTYAEVDEDDEDYKEEDDGGNDFDFTPDEKSQLSRIGESPKLPIPKLTKRVPRKLKRMKKNKNPDKSKKSIKCPVCDKICAGNYDLKVHSRVHTKEKPYCCEICNGKFTQSSAYHLHLRNIHGQSSSSFKRLKVDDKKFITEDQPKLDSKSKFKSSTLAATNFRRKRIQRIKNSEKAKKSAKCPFCDRICVGQYNLKVHIRTHTKEKPYCCSQEKCGARFSSSSAYHFHLRKTHGSGQSSKKLKVDDGAPKQYQCDTCGRSFPRAYTLKTHARVHNKEKPYVCAQCGKNFTQNSALRLHERKVHGRPVTERRSKQNDQLTSTLSPFLCPICGLTFAYKCLLERHMVFHGDARNFKCRTCNMTFKNLSVRNRHELIHKDVKSYLCTICGKSFSQSQGLRIHMITHTGEKPYKCKICGLDFGYNQTLKKHIKNFHGEEYLHLAGRGRNSHQKSQANPSQNSDNRLSSS